MLRFCLVDLQLVMVWSGQCTFQSPFPNYYSVCVGWYFLVRWVGFLVGSSKLWVYFGGYILFARDWNLHIIDSHVVSAIDWSFMELDAAWHEWVLVALAVVIDGMLAVSAPCGCCHHYLLDSVFLAMPMCVWYLFPFCYMLFGFIYPLPCVITWFPSVICFFSFNVPWCTCYGGYGLCFGGGLIPLFMYHHLFVFFLLPF